MEARSLPADRARAPATKVKEYRADLASLREQLKQAAATAGASDAARAELVRRARRGVAGRGARAAAPRRRRGARRGGARVWREAPAGSDGAAAPWRGPQGGPHA
jgi:hypothetical protein